MTNYSSTRRELRVIKLKELFEENPDKLLTTRDVINYTDETASVNRADLKFLTDLKIIERIETPNRGRVYPWNNTYKLRCKCGVINK